MGTVIAIAKQFWKEIAIVSLIAFIWGANEFYVERIKLQRDLAISQKETVENALERQSKEILEEAKRTRKAVEENFEELDDRLNDLSDEQKRQLEDLINLEIPEGCGEEFNEFLINVANEELRWNTNE